MTEAKTLDYTGIGGCSLFEGIEKNNIKAMLKCIGAYEKTYKKGEFISVEEDFIRSVGIVLSGVVDMIKEDVWGNSTVVVRMKDNEIMGETFACGSDSSTKVSFMAAEDTVMIFLPFEKVMHVCSNSCEFHHRLVQNMVVSMANKNRSLMEKIEVIAKRTLREKIMQYLSLQSEKQEGGYFEIPLGRTELANYLVADRTAVSRELANMKAEGIIDFDKKMFKFL